jgi:hypothetical protein
MIGAIKWADPSKDEGDFLERKRRWLAFKTLVHEYLHTLEHPSFTRMKHAANRAATLEEGVDEYFTKIVLDGVLPAIEEHERIRCAVEGVDDAKRLKPLGPDVLDRHYAYYHGYADDVQFVLDLLKDVTRDDLEAAFFQGHTDRIWLTPEGTYLDPPEPGMERAVIVPPDITTLSALSKRTGVGLPAIRAANPQLAWNAMAIPVNRRLAVPKWTTHVVVTAKEQDEEDRSETLLQIAAQHKAMTEEVKSANQHVDWTKPLPEGTPLLVPDR